MSQVSDFFKFRSRSSGLGLDYLPGNYASRKFEGDHHHNSKRLMLSCIYSLKFRYRQSRRHGGGFGGLSPPKLKRETQ